ncbi:MAG: zinc finger domain-containing protein [Pseudonocardiaceae bacterium]
MPEGHTTHRLAGEHQRCYGGSPVAVSSPQGRFAAAATVLDGRVLQRAQAHGKHLFHVNVYRAELLFRHQLDPLRPGAELRTDQWVALWSDLVELMGDGVRRGRIDTVAPEHDPIHTGRAPRQDRHGGEVYVYRRTGAPCLVCGTTVVTARHVGRNLYWCPHCQQRPAF